jgi:hypothetical protein
VTYTPIVLRGFVFALPFMALAGVTVLLKSVDASPALVFVTFALIAILTGSAIGLFGDRLPGFRARGERSSASRF